MPSSVIAAPEADRHVAVVGVGCGGKQRRRRIGLHEFVVAPTCQQRTGLVLRSHAGAEEAELRGSPTTSPISAPGTSHSVPSSMPNGTTHKRLQRSRRRRGSPGRRFRCRRSTSGPCRRESAAPARFRASIVRGPASHGAVEIGDSLPSGLTVDVPSPPSHEPNTSSTR